MQIADKSLGTDPMRAEHWPVPRRQAWFAFVMAFLLMVFDFMDRQIVVAMFPTLKAEWGLSDKELGALTAVVSITVAVFAFPVALLLASMFPVARRATRHGRRGAEPVRPGRRARALAAMTMQSD